MNKPIVCKFGGSSLADSNQFRKVKKIVEADSRRRFVIPSAPGKRFEGDTKITDLLYLISDLARQNENFDEQLNKVKNRYFQIIDDLNIDFDLDKEFELIKMNILKGASSAYAASRGEYLCAKILAIYLDFPFVDAKDLIVISRSTGLTRWKESRDRIVNRLKDMDRAVIPGFYGLNIKDEIITYSRGGSDVSAAIIARGLNALAYENWTDVSGFRMADPRIVPYAKRISKITYNELRELSYMGANVLHEESIVPCMRAGIPIIIKNTNNPDHEGTYIVDKDKFPKDKGPVSGISGRGDFIAINIEKVLLNQEKGILNTLISIFDRYDISIEHIPTGIDTITVVVLKDQIDIKLQRVIRDIQVQINPDNLSVYNDLGLIAIVGQRMKNKIGIASKVFNALLEEGINVKLISQGISEISILVGIEKNDLKRGIKSIYDAFK